ncbi:MAG TPA: GlsB/YeaQ/YmgE family stress response membrane protein [Longilinea sp.]|nr:GlsB/YeaQ/YmgE family stress response membrane protein [Longilinea sp.]
MLNGKTIEKELEMTFTGFLLLLIIAAVAGAVGQAIAGYSLGGCVTTIVVGFVGAFIGTWIASQFHLPDFLSINIDGEGFPLFWAVIGSALLTALLGWISRRRRTI